VRRAGLALIGLLTLVGIAAPARAGRLDEAWRRGNQAYLHGDYGAAIAAYQELRGQGVRSSDLFFNLGNAYVRTEARGSAIWAFEEALILDPGNEDARFNLSVARRAASKYTYASGVLPPEQVRDPLWVRVVTSLSASVETWLFAAAYLGLFTLLFWRLWAGADLRAGLAVGTAAFGVAALLTGALLVGRIQFERLSYGIVLPDRVDVREGADPEARSSFLLGAGARVRLVDSDQDWVRVRLADGLEGWLRASEVGKL
jgi:hypothetical protein